MRTCAINMINAAQETQRLGKTVYSARNVVYTVRERNSGIPCDATRGNLFSGDKTRSL